MSSIPTPAPERAPCRARLRLLAWAFTLFNTLRLVSYLPTILAIAQSADSSQHSLLTWAIWFGSNLTMALWLYEHNGARVDRAVAINLCNAAMCLATLALVAWFR